MRNPTRRNRNIGTSSQGFGQDNKLEIPYPSAQTKTFYERLGKYEKIKKTIQGREFIFVVEQTRETSKHACSVADVERIISQIPASDLGDLKLIVFRQPKRKEENLSSVWGRMIYSYDFENEFYAAIVLEAMDYKKKFKWTTKLSVEDQKELERLKEDGHEIKLEGKFYTAEYTLENVRNTQLYRTLLHEFGHYVHYLEVVEQPGVEDEEYDAWEKRSDSYFEIPKGEKEKYAHKYADQLRRKLVEDGIIPFSIEE